MTDLDMGRPEPLDLAAGDTAHHDEHGDGRVLRVRNPSESFGAAEIDFGNSVVRGIPLRSAKLHKVDAVDELPDDVDAMHRGQARMAYRLAVTYAGRLLHVHGIGWHTWDGRRWREDDQGEAKRAVLDVLRDALTESLRDPDLRKDVRRCESDAGLSGVLGIAGALEPFASTVRDLDTDPYLLNVANGTLDLRTMQLRDHDPADRITKVTRAAYDADAGGVGWDRFLERVLPDPEVREFLQRLAGVGLLGIVVEHVLAILTGTGANGKGTFYEALGWALGDYAAVAEPDLFMQREGAHPTGEMDLLGIRWVVVSENDKGRRLAEATLKRLTGGDPIRARRMRRDFVQFDPSHTPVLVTNHLPKVSGDDPAIWRRLRVIPFSVTIPEPERDGHLRETLQLDADAVLAWAVDGYADYAERGGLDEPEAVLVATGDYQLSSDAVGRFVNECCLVNPHAYATTGELFERWCAWASDDSADTMSRKAFGQVLDRRGFPTDPKSRPRVRRGLGLLSDDPDNASDASATLSPTHPTHSQVPPTRAHLKRDTGGASDASGLPDLGLTGVPGRCSTCGFHTATQGHTPTCPQVTP